MNTQPLVSRVTRWSLLFCLAAVPVMMLPGFTWDVFNLPKLALLVALVGVAFAARMVDRSRPAALRLCGLGVPGSLLIGALGVSWLVSPYRSWAWIGQYTSYQGLLPYGLIVVFGFLLVDSFHEDARPLALAVLCGSSLAAVYAVAQRAGFDPVDWDAYGMILPAGSTLGNPNYSGSLFAVVLPLAISCTWSFDSAKRWVAVASSLLILAGLVVSDSQVAWVAAVGGISVVIAGRFGSRHRLVALMGFVLVALSAMAVVGAVSAAISSDAVAEGSTPLQDRAWYWVAAGGAFKESPLVGKGPNSFAVEAVGHRVVEEGVERDFAFTFDPHSAPLMFAASSGIIGLSAFLFLFGWAARKAKASLTVPLGTGFLATLVAYFIQSLAATEQLTVRLVLWFSLAGLAIVTQPGIIPPMVTRPGKAMLLRVPVALATLVLVTTTASTLIRADHEVLNGIAAGRQGDLISSGLHLSRGVDLRSDNEYLRLLGHAYGDLAVAQRGSAAGTDFLEATDAAFSYTNTFPDPEAIADHAGIVLAMAESREDLERARSLYQRALKLDPVNPLIRVGVADTLIALGNPEAAHDILERLFYYFPPQPEFWGALALANAEAADWGVAASYLQQAFSLDPRDRRALVAEQIMREAGEL